MSEKPELLPCPFCGQKEDGKLGPVINVMGRHRFISCESCKLCLDPKHSEQEAIEAWNRRSSAPQAQGAGKVWGPEDEVGLAQSDKDGMAHSSIWFHELLPEVQAALNSAQERDMSPQEALAEAKKRWGDDAYVCFEGFGYGPPEHQELYHVGRASGPIFGNCYDVSGKTFRAAFASCDKAQGGEK